MIPIRDTIFSQNFPIYHNGILLYSIMVMINRGSNIGSKYQIVGFDFHDGMVGFFCF